MAKSRDCNDPWSKSYRVGASLQEHKKLEKTLLKRAIGEFVREAPKLNKKVDKADGKV